jgi:SpoVK/Ycf46/Vps4 family AAA+-type ATPase
MGYVLHDSTPKNTVLDPLTRSVGAFAVSQLEKVTWNEKIVESLVLDEHRKNFIRALVRYHGQKDDSNRFDDFVRDKGKGLVGLLSGPPGVGKTLTAEAVAEIAHRPLYSISSGELGESSSILQTRLIRVMELAETWRAVVLLDEADVFLTERSDEDLSRNAITSIFLRHLEYYQGILLLTTNRLDSFDKAFQSRIHFCFKYDALDVEARYSIWQTFVGRAKALTNVEVCLEENDIRKLADNELNGRQIKNIMGIAQSVAAEKNEPITLDSILLAKSFAMIPWNKPNEGFA